MNVVRLFVRDMATSLDFVPIVTEKHDFPKACALKSAADSHTCDTVSDDALLFNEGGEKVLEPDKNFNSFEYSHAFEQNSYTFGYEWIIDCIELLEGESCLNELLKIMRLDLLINEGHPFCKCLYVFFSSIEYCYACCMESVKSYLDILSQILFP